MNTRRIGLFEVALFALVVFFATACGGPPVEAQQPQPTPVPARPTDDPNVMEITELPEGGISISVYIGSQPLYNTNSYSVGMQCKGVPSVADEIQPHAPHPGYGGVCPEVTMWRK